MVKEKIAPKKKVKSTKRRYDFKDNNPKRILTRDETLHLDECMRPRNKSIPANKMDIEGATKSVIAKMRKKYS